MSLDPRTSADQILPPIGPVLGIWHRTDARHGIAFDGPDIERFGLPQQAGLRALLRAIAPSHRRQLLDVLRADAAFGQSEVSLSLARPVGDVAEVTLVLRPADPETSLGWQSGHFAVIPRAVARGERLLSDIEKTLPGAILVYIVHPGGGDSIDYMSPGCRNIWGLPPEVALTDPGPLWDMIDQDDLPAMQSSLEASMSDMSLWHHVWHITTPDGVRKCVEGRGRPRLRSDGAVVWTTLVMDITTEEKAAQDAARLVGLYSELQQTDTAAQIARTAGHDFNNLLTIIIGNAELIEDATPAAAGSDQYVREILAASRRAQALTRRLTRVLGASNSDVERLNVSAMVADLRSLLSRILPPGVTLKLELAPDLPDVETNRDLLDSAVLNLVLNARDALPDGGRITVSTRFQTLSESRAVPGGGVLAAGGYVVLDVQDDGLGFDPDMIDTALEPRVTSKPMGQGAGLGLSMVDGFARNAGGAVTLQSVPGRGASLSIYLPAAPMAAASARQAAQ